MKVCKRCNNEKDLDQYSKNLRYKKDLLDPICRECHKEKYNKEKEIRLERCKEWRKNNKDYSNNWRKNNENRQNYEKNYYQENKDKYIERKTEWRKNNPEKAKLERENYQKNNREKINLYSKNWKQNKRKNDIQFLLKDNLSRRIRYEMKKDISTSEYIGCSMEYVKLYLESKFTNGMNWDNYGIFWHIDHIIPCNSWNFTNSFEVHCCWNYRNLQPLHCYENKSKNNKYNELNKLLYLTKMKTILL